jgi:hypothetical protein
MRGRLKANLGAWQRITTNLLVLGWIAHGFDLQWSYASHPPLPHIAHNHPTTSTYSTFVDEAVAELCITQAARRVDSRPLVVSPLGVVPKKDKLRLIFDGRYINSHIHIPTFKFETLAHVPNILRLGDYVFTLDLKSGYHHIDIREQDTAYLGFSWKDQWYVFQQLPFGLAPACWCFTIVMRTVLRFFRLHGIRCTGYIDDSLYGSEDLDLLRKHQQFVLHTLASLGFIVNLAKCQLQLCHTVTYLGMLIATDLGIMLVPQQKRDALFALIHIVVHAGRNAQHVPVRLLASIKGKLLSMAWAFGPIVVSAYTRALDRAITSTCQDWSAVLIPTAAVLTDLQFWVDCFDRFNGRRHMWPPTKVHTIIHTDAAGRSDLGEGAWAGFTNRGAIAHGMWDGSFGVSEADESSTWRELTAVLRSLRAFHGPTQALLGHSVLVHTDNQNVEGAINKGSSKAPLCVAVLKDIFWFCISHDIRLSAVWIPREHNTVADALSKFVDPTDIQLCPSVFAHLNSAWGPFSCDLFASEASTQLPHFFSRFHQPSSSGIDAFACSWSGRCWAYPPFGLISRFWQHVFTCEATSVAVVIPFHPHASWWSFVQPTRTLPYAARYISDIHILHPSLSLLVDCTTGVPRFLPALPFSLLVLNVQLCPTQFPTHPVIIPNDPWV